MVCSNVYGILRVHQGYKLVRYKLSPLHSSEWSNKYLHTDPRDYRSTRPLVISSPKSGWSTRRQF